MPLDALPSELISRIFEELGHTGSPFRVARIRQLARTLASLRLTSRRISEIATRYLFREFCLIFEPGSWKKLLCIARNPKLAKYLYYLRLEFYDFNEPSSGNEFQSISLSWFPNLKSIDCDQWTAITVNIAACRVCLHYPFFIKNGSHLWCCLSCTGSLAREKINFESLRMGSKDVVIWGMCLLRNLDLSRLTFLDLYFNSYSTKLCRKIYLEWLLPELHDLPNLDTFRLAQDSSGLRHWQTDQIPNIVGGLKGKSWPRLRHLEFRHLVTTVADLVTFTLPHMGALEEFRLYGELACSSVSETKQERINRTYLEGWIRAEIRPAVAIFDSLQVRYHTHVCWPGPPDGEEEL